MKNLITVFATLIATSGLTAQTQFSVASGTNLSIGANTTLSAGGLSLKPTARFILTNTRLSKSISAVNTTTQNYVTRVFMFSNVTTGFTGEVRYAYTDAEAGSLQEANLQVHVYQGSFWEPLISSENNTTANYVRTSLSAKPMKELLLKEIGAILAIRFIEITANRNNGEHIINWKTSGLDAGAAFIVEKSLDNRNWTTVSPAIPSHTLVNEATYHFRQVLSINGATWYRIRVQGMNGSTGYSKTVMVPAGETMNELYVYPNPVNDHFSLNIPAASIQAMQLFDQSGRMVQQFKSGAGTYNLSNIAGGIYLLLVTLRDGSILKQTLSRQ